LKLDAPLTRIIDRLKSAQFIFKGKSYPKFIWLNLDHARILHLYNSVARGYLNYYSFTHNYNRVVQLTQTIIKSSCAKLLAAKYTLGTQAKVYQKFGKDLSKPDKNGKIHSFIRPKYGITIKFLGAKNSTNIDNSPIIPLYAQKSLATFENLSCSRCGSTYRVEMHHIRAMKNLNPKISHIDRLMIRANRKQIPLCRSCHMTYHRSP